MGTNKKLVLILVVFSAFFLGDAVQIPARNAADNYKPSRAQTQARSHLEECFRNFTVLSSNTTNLTVSLSCADSFTDGRGIHSCTCGDEVFSSLSFKILRSGQPQTDLGICGGTYNTSSPMTITCSNADYYTNYTLCVTLSGETACFDQFVTDPGIPSQVENFKAAVCTQTTIEFAWSKPLEPNGMINGFEIELGNSERMDFGAVYSWNFSRMQPNTQLRIGISAYNQVKGKRLYSVPVEAIGKTLDCYPSSPRNVTAKSLSDGEIEVTWTVPQNTNGRAPGVVDGYQVTISGGGSGYSEYIKELRHVFTNLRGNTKYDITVQAFNAFDTWFCISGATHINAVSTKSSSNAGLIAGVVIGVVGFVGGGAFVAYRFYFKRKY